MPRPLALATLLLTALLLAGCAAGPAPKPTVTASAAPLIFETDAEALAAAEEVIQKYWNTANAVFQAGGEGVEAFEPLVTQGRFNGERKLSEIFVSQGLEQSGNYTVDSIRLQQTYRSVDGQHIIATACVDYSDVVATTPDGKIAKRATVEPRLLHQVTLHATGSATDPVLLLDKSDPQGDASC